MIWWFGKVLHFLNIFFISLDYIAVWMRPKKNKIFFRYLLMSFPFIEFDSRTESIWLVKNYLGSMNESNDSLITCNSKNDCLLLLLIAFLGAYCYFSNALRWMLRFCVINLGRLFTQIIVFCFIKNNNTFNCAFIVISLISSFLIHKDWSKSPIYAPWKKECQI